MAADYSSIRSALATLVGAVAGITGGAGKVITYRLHESRPDDFQAAAKGAARLHLWEIYREGVTDRQVETGLRAVTTHDIVVTGRYAVTGDGSASEAAFGTIIDAVINALRCNVTVWTLQPESGPIEIRGFIRHDMYCGTLCHFCELRIGVDQITVLSS